MFFILQGFLIILSFSSYSFSRYPSLVQKKSTIYLNEELGKSFFNPRQSHFWKNVAGYTNFVYISYDRRGKPLCTCTILQVDEVDYNIAEGSIRVVYSVSSLDISETHGKIAIFSGGCLQEKLAERIKCLQRHLQCLEIDHSVERFQQNALDYTEIVLIEMVVNKTHKQGILPDVARKCNEKLIELSNVYHSEEDHQVFQFEFNELNWWRVDEKHFVTNNLLVTMEEHSKIKDYVKCTIQLNATVSLSESIFGKKTYIKLRLFYIRPNSLSSFVSKMTTFDYRTAVNNGKKGCESLVKRLQNEVKGWTVHEQVLATKFEATGD